MRSGSGDGTVARLRALAAEDDRITIVDEGGARLGPAGSFMHLLSGVESGLFAFCDQDDVWEPHKLAWSVAELRRTTRPIAAVYTDAYLADNDARIVAPSALRARGVTHAPSFGELLMVNAAIGATMVGTAELARVATVIDDPFMHDWWCALVAAYAGDLRLLRAPTLRWRRHAATATGGTARAGRIGNARRRDYLAWSSRAARLLDEDSSLRAVDSATERAAGAMADLDRHGPSLRGLAAADRAGVRAWPARRRLTPYGAIASRRVGRMG